MAGRTARQIRVSPLSSETHHEVHVKDVAVPAHRIRHRRVSHRAVIKVYPLGVDKDASRTKREPVGAGPELRSVAIMPHDLRPTQVSLKYLGDRHRGGLH